MTAAAVILSDVESADPDEGERWLLPSAAAINRARDQKAKAVQVWRAMGGYRREDGTRTQPELYAAVENANRRIARHRSLALPTDQDGLVARLRAHNPAAVEEALTWLEYDPFVRHSGYLKQKLMRQLRLAPLTPAQVERVRTLVLALASKGRRSEFANTIRLGVSVDAPDFRRRLQGLTLSPDPETAAAATRILAACATRGTHGVGENERTPGE
jgi:hypothetical protein